MLLLVLPIALQAAGKFRRIDNPTRLYNGRDRVDLFAIELSDTATVLEYRINYMKGSWHMFPSTSMLRDDKGRTYPIVRLDSKFGIQMDDLYFHDPGGEVIVRKVYPPLPDNVLWVDDTQPNDEGWGTYGIRLYEQPRPELQVPPTQQLPPLELKFGMAEIKGHIMDYHEGSIKDVTLINAPVALYGLVLDTLVCRPDAKGDFHFRFPVTHITPKYLWINNRSSLCYVAPGQTTEVYVNLREITNPSDNWAPRAYQVSGPLADVATELNQYPTCWSPKHFFNGLSLNKPDSLSSQALYDTLYQQIDHNARRWTFDANHYDRGKCVDCSHAYSPVANELAEASKMISALGAIEPSNPSGAELMHQKLSDPTALYYPEIQVVRNFFPKSIQMPDALDDDFRAQALRDQLRNCVPFDSKQMKQSLKTLPKAYEEWLTYENEQLQKTIRENQKRTGSIIRKDIPKVDSKDLYNAIIERYKSRPIFLTAWKPASHDPWQYDFINKVVKPLQAQFADEQDIAWITIHDAEDHEPLCQQEAALIRGDHYFLSHDAYTTLVETIHPDAHEYAQAIFRKDGKCIEWKRFYVDRETNERRIIEALQK